MTEKKDEIQNQVSQLIHQDIVNIVTHYANNSKIDLDLILRIIQDINLFNVYKVEYIHNYELDEIIDILKNELKEKNAANISLLSVLDYLLKKEESLKKALYVNLFSKVHQDDFMDAFSVFAVLNPTVKELFSDFMRYIFNDVFLDLTEEIQIDYIYKAWNFSQHLFHDNDASQFAYKELKVLFDKALEQEKTEVAFWLYYTPLHYYNSGTDGDINKANKKFSIEVEKPLEKYIQEILIPKYKIKPNKKIIDKTKKIKVAFVMQRIIKHSTVNVFYSLVKSLMENPSKEYEFILYDLSFAESGGSNLSYVEEFKSLGIKYINLHTQIFKHMSPTYSLVEKCLKTREILINDEIDIFIGLHTRVEYIFLYATRTTAKQIYWYHSSNAEYEIESIDLVIGGGSGIKDFEKTKYKYKYFDTARIIENDNPKINLKTVSDIRKRFDKEAFILGSIGRLVKIESKKYLDSVAEIMYKNPNTIFLACGDGDPKKIIKMVEDLKLLDRFYFEGHVDSHIYGHVIDLFLDSFPLRNGESAAEFRNKGKMVLTNPMNRNIFDISEFLKYIEVKRKLAKDKEHFKELINNITYYLSDGEYAECSDESNIKIYKRLFSEYVDFIESKKTYVDFADLFIKDTIFRKRVLFVSNAFTKAQLRFDKIDSAKRFVEAISFLN